LLGIGRFFSFLILDTVGGTVWTGDQPVTRPLLTHTATKTQTKHTKTAMLQVGFEATTPVFERAKTVHDINRVATVICFGIGCQTKITILKKVLCTSVQHNP
jgi:hypothetical protein